MSGFIGVPAISFVLIILALILHVIQLFMYRTKPFVEADIMGEGEQARPVESPTRVHVQRLSLDLDQDGGMGEVDAWGRVCKGRLGMEAAASHQLPVADSIVEKLAVLNAKTAELRKRMAEYKPKKTVKKKADGSVADSGATTTRTLDGDASESEAYNPSRAHTQRTVEAHTEAWEALVQPFGTIFGIKREDG